MHLREKQAYLGKGNGLLLKVEVKKILLKITVTEGFNLLLNVKAIASRENKRVSLVKEHYREAKSLSFTIGNPRDNN